MSAAETFVEICDRQVRLWQRCRGESWTAPEVLLESIDPRDVTELAHALGSVAKERLNGRVSLLLPASWCYVHALQVPQRRPSPAVLEFALEEYLPLEIEKLECCFVPAQGGNWIGVAIEHERIRPIVDALDAACEIIRIGISGTRQPAESRQSGCRIWCDHEHVVISRSVGGQYESIRVVRLIRGLDESEWHACVADELRGVLETQPDRIELAGPVAGEWLAALRAEFCPTAEVVSPEEALTSIDPRIELANGQLAPVGRAVAQLRSLRRCACVAAVALLAIAVGLGLQIRQAQNRTDEVAAWERAMYASIFPGEPVPAGVALRIASEQRRLEQLTRSQGDEVAGLDALALLRTVVSGLPAEVRIDLQELRLEDADVSLRGRTRDHAHAELVAGAFKKLSGWQIDPPRTDRQSDGTVQFFVHARPEPPAKKESPK